MIDNTHNVWGHQAKLNIEILQQLKLTQGFLHAQGRKGFRFHDNKYMIINEYLTDTGPINILGSLLEDESEVLYKRHLYLLDKTLVFACVWFSLKLTQKQSCV